MTQGTLQRSWPGPTAQARRTAWENYTDQYLAHKNTLATNLATSIKQNVFQNARPQPRARRLEASLFEHNIPHRGLPQPDRRPSASNLPTWHRYWAIRRKALGVDDSAPLRHLGAADRRTSPPIPYEQAVDWICDGLAPLGESTLRPCGRGCLEERWVDVYPNQGKTGGRLLHGAPGTLSLHRDELQRQHLQPEHAGPRAGPLHALLPHLAEPAA